MWKPHSSIFQIVALCTSTTKIQLNYFEQNLCILNAKVVSIFFLCVGEEKDLKILEKYRSTKVQFLKKTVSTSYL